MSDPKLTRYFDPQPAERVPAQPRHTVTVPWHVAVPIAVLLICAVVAIVWIVSNALTGRPTATRPAPTTSAQPVAAPVTATVTASPTVPTPSPTGQAPGAPLESYAKNVVPESTTSTAWTPPSLDGTPAVYWEKNAEGYCANYDTSEQPCTAIGATETGGVPPTGGTP